MNQINKLTLVCRSASVVGNDYKTLALSSSEECKIKTLLKPNDANTKIQFIIP